MRLHPACLALVCGLFTLPATAADTVVALSTDTATFEVDDRGSLAALRRTAPDRNLMAPGQPAPLLQFRVAGAWQTPASARWDAARRELYLSYPGALTATVSLTARPTHVVLELVGVTPSAGADLARWGPYPIAIGETIGEIVGVVRDRRDAVGIQALNPKTLGGSPQNENDIDAEFGADDTGHYPDLPGELRLGQGFRGDTARPMPFGSVLQAYTRDRSQPRVIANWGHEQYAVPPVEDGGLTGSRIALFATDEPSALSTIGAIERAEGLPHPLLDGVWAKVSPAATAAYLIVDFSEENVDRAIEMTRRAGLRYLYHSSPFETWGHFELKRALFPNGWVGFRRCVERARAAGVSLGIHTLSNFTTPNDPYVTPVPDPRLAVIGSSELTEAIEATATEIAVRDPALFRKKSTLNAVRLGDELVRFQGVSEAAPWRLLKCERGAWGTRAGEHRAGTAVARLLDHEYQVFFGDLSLSLEMARNIAEFCNRTGVRQLSFDGLEGNWSTGQGQYGRTLFTMAWHEALDPELRGQLINDASNPGHFNWHINTRMNWGEPWYAGFRESQTLYRFKNQVLFQRNLMPAMLGWFALRPDTSIEDAEWLLARAAGFDAGFALATSLASTAQLAADPASAETSRQYGATTAILATIATWESARMARAFTPEVRARLRDNTREFVLKAAGDHHRRWELREAYVGRLIHVGELPGTSLLEFKHPAPPQRMQWILRNEGKVPVQSVKVSVDRTTAFELVNAVIPPGGSVKYSGGGEAVVSDHAWKEIGRVPVPEGQASSGPWQVELSAVTPREGRVRLEVRALGAAETVSAP